MDRYLAIQRLRQQIQQQETVSWRERPRGEVPQNNNHEGILTVFPGQSTTGKTIELLGEPGQGRTSFAAGVVAESLETSAAAGQVVLIADAELPSPLAWTAFGVPLQQLLVIRTASLRESLWAAEQSLRCAGVAAVTVTVGRTLPVNVQRLKRAAEAGRTAGILLRPTSVQRETCWSDFRFLVQPEHDDNTTAVALRQQWRLQALYQRGAVNGAEHMRVQLDDNARWHIETHPLPVAAELADPAISQRRKRSG